ncbi:MAG: flagellar motor switch protein FliM [Fidelibacterota bacterium]
MKVLSAAEMDVLYDDANKTMPLKAKSGKVSKYDFKHPNLLSKEQLDLIRAIHQGIAASLSTYLSDQLRLIVDMAILEITQNQYADYKNTIGTPVALYVGELNKEESNIILEFEPKMGIFLVERLLGGMGEKIEINRNLSPIEQRIVKKIITIIGHELEKSWTPIHKLNCEFNRYEEDPLAVQILSASEPVVVVSFEVKYQDQESVMNICYPYKWIANLLTQVPVKSKPTYKIKSADEKEQKTLENNLKKTSVTLRAILGDRMVSINDLINLQEGDIIQLGKGITDFIPVKINGYHLYDALVGTHGNNYAVAITSIVKGVDNE